MFHTKGPVLHTYESFIAKLLQKFDFTLEQARIQFRNLKLWPCSCQRKPMSVWPSPLLTAKNGCELLNRSGCSLQFPALRLQLYPSRSTKVPLNWLQPDALRCLARAAQLTLALYEQSSSCSRPPAQCEQPAPQPPGFHGRHADAAPRRLKTSTERGCRGLAAQSRGCSKAFCNN